jgi:1-acyl-sn-glycerol-3-phosphate acyltransferase
MKRLLQQLWVQSIYYLALLFFGLGSLFYNVTALLFSWLPDTPRTKRVFQKLIHIQMRLYIGILSGSRAMRVEYDGWEKIPKKTGVIILANHPSSVDAPMILSRRDRTICFFKSSLQKHLLSAVGARMAGFVSNSAGIDGIRSGVQHLMDGGWVLIFPEGTRSSPDKLMQFHSGFALLASRAKCPVVCLGIDSDSNVLSKSTRFWLPPRLPANFTIRTLGVVMPDGLRTTTDWQKAVAGIYKQTYPTFSAIRESK